MSKYADFVYEDSDLYNVLQEATEEEQKMLVELLCTKSSCVLHVECQEIAAIVNEFQLMGGNSIVNVARGHGVCYSEIVGDVAKQVKVDVDGCKSVGEKEWRIVEHLIERAEEKMDDEQKKAFYEEVRKQSGVQQFKSVADLLGNQAIYNAIRLVIIKIVARQLLVRLGIKSAAKLASGRLLTLLAGPLGWVLGAIWAVIDVSGPAYSITVPGVMLVAMIRTRSNALNAEQAAQEIGGDI